MVGFDEQLGRDFDEIRDAGLWRELREIESAQSTRVTLDGREFINFSSNDYLGLAAHPALGRAIAGWHIEGPFLSAETGYCGAHPADKMLRPTPERVAELRELAGDDPLLLTMAPEVNGGLKGFATARELGIRVSIGEDGPWCIVVDIEETGHGPRPIFNPEENLLIFRRTFVP